MQKVVVALILVVALINFAPVVGGFSESRLHSLYGVGLGDPNLVILMRHRAVLLGLVGALLGASAFVPHLRPLAAVADFVSMLSFVALAWMVGDLNPQLTRIAAIDIAAVVMLAAALFVDRRTD